MKNRNSIDNSPTSRLRALDFRRVMLVMVLTVFSISVSHAQKEAASRKSPPTQITQQIGETTIIIDYSRPSMRGRKIFGALEAYGKVWRTGANETTWIQMNRDVKVEGKLLPKGKYGLFTIPGREKWTIIFNEKWDGWGAYEYNASDDVLRVEVKPKPLEERVEILTIETNAQGQVCIKWEQTMVCFNIQ